MWYLFKLFIEFLVSETFELSLTLLGVELLPEDTLDVLLLDDPGSDGFLLLLLLDDDVGSVDLFFLEFVGLDLLGVFDVGGVFLVAA